MGARKGRSKRDIEKEYTDRQFVAKLRRLADCIEQGKRLRIEDPAASCRESSTVRDVTHFIYAR
jgi:hypothetical protein